MDNSYKANIKWKEVITAQNNIWSFNLKQIWEYKDLLMIWMRRDILSIYKQTILGPLWFILQPALTTLVYFILFSKIARFPTPGIPPVIFYLSGIIVWNYFADCFTKTATFLKDNTAIFSKVFFPRLIIPVSIVLTNLVKFSIQLLLLFAVVIYYVLTGKLSQPNLYILLLPALMILCAGLGLAGGILVSSVTIKYKDLFHLIAFGTQLLMFTCPVFYDLSAIPVNGYRNIVLYNPLSGIIEAFRYGITGTGYFDWQLLLFDGCFMLVLMFIAIITYNHVEKDFVDKI